jgi:hypothetical protein
MRTKPKVVVKTKTMKEIKVPTTMKAKASISATKSRRSPMARASSRPQMRTKPKVTMKTKTIKEMKATTKDADMKDMMAMKFERTRKP